MRLRRWVAGMVLVCLGGCTAQVLHRSGMELVSEGKYEEGIAALGKAVEAAPRDAAIRKDWHVTKLTVESRLLGAAQTQLAAGNLAAAQGELRKLLAISPSHAQGQQAMARLQLAEQHVQAIAAARLALQAGATGRALALVNQVLAEDPNQRAAIMLKRSMEAPQFAEHFKDASLKEGGAKPINLDFRDANVRTVLEVLSNVSGVGFLIDKDVGADLRVTVGLQNAEIDEALNLILRSSQLRSKILNNKTVQIYPDTPEKRKEYQELVVRAFYLQDAGAVQIQNVLKSLLRMKDVVIDERLNLVTVRDTPEAIQLAERLVALHDLPEPEVMLELEVLEVQRDDLLKLGVQWPNQFGVVIGGGSGGTIPLDDLRGLSSSRLGISFSNPSINLRQDVGVTNLLANPRIRVHNREKANVLIGDKVPVVTTTSNATGFVADNIQYLDVGLKLTAEPVIHPNSEVSLRLALEVSSIANQISTPNGSVAYQVGTRNAATFLRLQDGETQVLAGLISDQDRRSASGVPGLGRLPLLGRLFSSPSDSRSKTEIVLSVTPRVVRGAARPEAQAVQFWSGTENGLSTAPVRLSSTSTTVDAQSAETAAAPAVPAPPPQVPQLPQFVWSGPNQVKANETFTLSLRMKAPAGALRPTLRLTSDPNLLEVIEVMAGIPDQADGPFQAGAIAFDSAGQTTSIDLGKALSGGGEGDGVLLTLKARAKGKPGQAAVHLGPADGPALASQAIKVVP